MQTFEYKCPFCGMHPFEYVDVGVGMMPVAITCCEWYYGYSTGDKYLGKVGDLLESDDKRRNRHGMRLLKKIYETNVGGLK